MEGIPRENPHPPDFLPQMTWKGYGRDTQGESVRLPSSDDPKRLWKGYQGKKLLDWGFPKDKDKDKDMDMDMVEVKI
jgi:hypothetical protein